MIAVPLPFVIALLFSFLGINLYLSKKEDAKPALIFVGLCILMFITMGLRGEYPQLGFARLQALLASFIPFSTWYCFKRATAREGIPLVHFLGPVIVAVALIVPALSLLVDFTLLVLFSSYAYALFKLSNLSGNEPIMVNLGNLDRAFFAQKCGAYLLAMSAAIDLIVALDLSVFSASYSPVLLSVLHILIVPALALTVAAISSLTINEQQANQEEEPRKEASIELSYSDATEIVRELDAMLLEKKYFLDPELTLNRLSRKMGVPARKLSAAVNQVNKLNLSKFINQYRIEHAKDLLTSTEDSITQISLSSGFMSKSNFNREFSRIVMQTPSRYRLECAKKQIRDA